MGCGVQIENNAKRLSIAAVEVNPLPSQIHHKTHQQYHELFMHGVMHISILLLM